MTFTFDPTTGRGRVRLLVYDTDTATTANQIFTDAEIDALLALENQDVFAAAAVACRSIAAQAGRSAIRYVAKNILEIDRKSVPQFFLDLAAQYHDRAVSGEPWEINDSIDYGIDRYGRDQGEQWGDVL